MDLLDESREREHFADEFEEEGALEDGLAEVQTEKKGKTETKKGCQFKKKLSEPYEIRRKEEGKG